MYGCVKVQLRNSPLHGSEAINVCTYFKKKKKTAGAMPTFRRKYERKTEKKKFFIRVVCTFLFYL